MDQTSIAVRKRSPRQSSSSIRASGNVTAATIGAAQASDDIARILVHEAVERDADLLAVGHAGSRRPKRFVVGSIASLVAYLARALLLPANVPGAPAIPAGSHRVLIMVQLNLLQRLGYFPMLVDVPSVIIDHIRTAMRARTLSRTAVARYDVSGTRIRHQKLLRGWLDIRAFDAGETAWLSELASAEAGTKIERPDIINVLIEELVRRRYERHCWRRCRASPYRHATMITRQSMKLSPGHSMQH